MKEFVNAYVNNILVFLIFKSIKNIVIEFFTVFMMHILKKILQNPDLILLQ